MKKYLAEMVGTMVLVLMGCGVAVSLGCDPVNNIPAYHRRTNGCQRGCYVHDIPVHRCIHWQCLAVCVDC